jgi:hypothetical protein
MYGIAVYMSMHTVIETPDYLQDAKDAGLSEDEMAAIIKIIASDPKAGDVMVGTGGARKLRFAASGKGQTRRRSHGALLWRRRRSRLHARGP